MIGIRPAKKDEKFKTYEWLCRSDITGWCMGEPDYPEHPVPDWEDYRKDFEDFYFDTNDPRRGALFIIHDGENELGCVCHSCFHLAEGCAELDIWMKSSSECGKGYGPEALKLLTHYLHSRMGITRFIIRPAERNLRAIRSYEKAGFERVDDKFRTVERFLRPEYRALYGEGDYGPEQTACLVKIL